VSEDNESNRAAEFAKASEAIARQMEPFNRASEALARQMEPFNRASAALARQMEPLIRSREIWARRAEQTIRGYEAVARQMEPFMRNREALARQMEPMFQAAERFARVGIWPVPPFQQQLIRTVNAALRELPPPVITGSGSVALPPIRIIADGDVVNAAENETVEAAPDSRGGLAERSIGQIFALVLVAILMSGLLGVQGPDRAAVDHYLTVIGVALTIAVLIWNKNR